MKFLAAPAFALMVLTTTAYAQTKMPTMYDRGYGALPPPEYDRPYTGELYILRPEAERMAYVCPKTRYGTAIACAQRFGNTHCHVVIAPDEVLKAAGWTYEIVLRHERAHCNNWPNNHPGARPLAVWRPGGARVKLHPQG